MGRFARVIVVDVPHHVTQRGNGRRFILETDADRMVYLDLLRHYVQEQELSLMGYCLMSNHVHLIVIPRKSEALAVAMKHTHGRYASYWNVRHISSGHVWQGRFYSCPLDEVHQWAALRYAELNPVRAGLVQEPEAWPWSSAGAHCGTAAPDAILEMREWRERWNESSWREYLAAGSAEEEIAAIRQCTYSGRPLGTPEFIEGLEQSMQRQLAPQKGGRPKKPAPDKNQGMLVFDGE